METIQNLASLNIYSYNRLVNEYIGCILGSTAYQDLFQGYPRVGAEIWQHSNNYFKASRQPNDCAMDWVQLFVTSGGLISKRTTLFLPSKSTALVVVRDPLKVKRDSRRDEWKARVIC
jgi:hypothetical protein